MYGRYALILTAFRQGWIAAIAGIICGGRCQGFGPPFPILVSCRTVAACAPPPGVVAGGCPLYVLFKTPVAVLGYCLLDDVVMSGESRAEWLESRTASALTLREFDANARRLGITQMVGRLARERKFIASSLKAFGGVPWKYSPDGDNSWIAG